MILKFNKNFKKQIYQELSNSNKLEYPYRIVGSNLLINNNDFDYVEKVFKRLCLRFKIIS
jgi:hypothetical protein